MKKELETLIYAIRCQGIGIEFGLEKYAMLGMNYGKQHITEEMELTNQDRIKKLVRINLQILGHLGGWHCGDEKKIKKEYLSKTRKLLET